MAWSGESDAESDSSDKELQIAFERGLLKEGLNFEAPAPKSYINDVQGLEASLAELKSDLPWVERLDLTAGLAPTPHVLLEQLGENANAPELTGDDVHDDFKREMRFYRQAQAAVLAGIPKLHKLGVPTHRPEDYFAEMAKSDHHMKKVREKLLSKQVNMERSEKAKKTRELRKYGKKVQQDVLQKRQKEKKEMLEAVKKYRKGKEANVDFLDEKMLDRKSVPKNAQLSQNKKGFQTNKRRAHKNEKYGYGGQKKRSKYNTAESSRDTSDFNPRKHSMTVGKLKHIKKGHANKNKRPGKNRRQTMKGKKK